MDKESMQKLRPQTGFKKKNPETLINVTIEDINKYMDLLYEDDYEKKIMGCRNMLYLSMDPENMIALCNVESLLDLLSRTLKEEYKKNMEISIYLLAFFYSYCCYEEFHEHLASYGIGETCIKIIEYQIAKYIIRKAELERKYEQHKFTNPGLYEKELNKFLFMIRKQDRILRISISILTNLAENQKIERKIVKRDIVALLIKNLDRPPNINLIAVILLFLKKLSVYDCNKDQMIKLDITGEFNK